MSDGFSNLCNVLAALIVGVIAFPVIASLGIALIAALWWLGAVVVQGVQWVLA